MPHRLASGRGLVWCPDWFQGTSLGSSPDCFPDWFPGTSLGSCLDSFPDSFPGTSLGSCLEQVSRNLLQDVQTCSRTSKPPIPGNRRFGRVLGREGRSRGPIPYSIYISQFQTGTPKPRYIGFRDGGRENGTQNGQFRPVFGHILWPLSGPSLFHEIRDFSRPRARFLTFREKS